MVTKVGKISNRLLSLLAGTAAFALTLLGFLLLGDIDEQIGASLLIGTFALVVVRTAAERPNSAQARAMAALRERLLAVGRGDLASPAPAVLAREMPALAGAVNGLFEQVRSTLDDAHALAMYDPVTALPNRIHFRREAERALKARKTGEGAAILFIDLDGFKEVNDRLGHAQGDQVLIMVANRLRVVVKAETEADTLSPPILARLAGDEFTIFLPGVGSAAEAERIAGRALAALAEPFRPNGASSCLSGSIGIALAPEHGAELTDLMRAADLAMYDAKERGRSRFSTYSPALGLASAERSRCERELRDSLQSDDLELAFRPEFCLREGMLLGAEARVCRRRQGEPPVSLDKALHALGDESGLVLEYGDWTLRALARTLGHCNPARPEQRLSVDIHVHQLVSDHGLKPILDRLDSVGACPVELRLSEPAATRLDDRGLARLAALRGHRISIALDDFGAAGCAFGRLRALPLDRVKLDSALVARIDRDETDRTALAALIHLLHGLGLEAIAKGVARHSQIEVLRAVGCDGVQGPACGDSLGEAEFLRWVGVPTEKLPLARAS